MTRRGALTAGAVALVVALGAAACQAAAPIASLGPDQLATIQADDRLISTRLSPDEQALVVNAHGSVVAACMQELGWDFTVGTLTAATLGGGPSTLSPLEQWTFDDASFAESAGYGFETYLRELSAFRAGVEAVESEAHEPDLDSMSSAERDRFWLDFGGTDDERIEIVERDGSKASIAGGGCIGEAERAVYGDIAQKLRLQDARTTAESEIWGATFSDQAVTRALSSWKDCVSKQGLAFEDPHEAFDAALSAAQSGDHAQERLVATTDASCKSESSLGRAVEAAFLAATSAEIGDLEDDLVALQQFEQDALDRAKDVITSGG